uniref:Cell surface protein n=1 Tax=Enterococcus faecium TaxID=1352 RepID=A0A0D5MB83_ENTFC|nr:immunoglobulin-like domain-containing protein [Enterococcus faecium]AJY53594.1 cell surface protein [Enterococcus faecium]
MKKKWVTGLVLGSLFFQVSSPMIGFAQEITESTTTTNAAIKKEDKAAPKSLTNSSSLKESDVKQISKQTETKNPNETEKQYSNNQKATAQPLLPVAPIADENLLKNPSFELPSLGEVQTYVPEGTPGLEWKSIAADHTILIGKNILTPPPEGVQYAYLDGVRGSNGIYQDIKTKPGTIARWSFYYRARAGATSPAKLKLKIGAPNSTLEDIETLDSVTAWKKVSGEYEIPQGQTVTRFQLELANNTGDPASDMHIDNVVFAGEQMSNIPPVIHLPSSTPSVAQGSTFDPAPSKWNVTATDTEDGDLTSKIVVESNNVDTSKPGQYQVTYSVKDSGNLQTEVDMPVIVTPRQDQARIEFDHNPLILNQGDKFPDTPKDAGVHAYDTDGTDLTNSITILDSNVDMSKPGDYKVTYFVMTHSGGIMKELDVTVKPTTPAHTLDLTVDKDTFDIKKGESVEATGEIWSNTTTAMQSVSIKNKGEATSIDGTSFLSTPANQHNKYSLTIPADKLTVGVNTFEVIGVDDQSTVSTKEITVNVSQPSDLIELKNGSFEKPLISGANRGQTFTEGTPDLEWQTTAADHTIELQNITRYGPAPDGQQWAELNASDVGALYQDVQTKPGSIVRWSVYHRGRDGEDVAKVKFGVPNGKMEEIQTMKTGTTWTEYSGVYKIPDGQTVTRFQFEAVSTSSGDNSKGNLLDHVVFTNEQIGEKPVIQAEDKTIAQNSTFDPLDGVSATDKEDGTVPVTVHENTVDTSTPGTYNVVYWATDSDKNTTEKTITVTVEPSELSFNVPDILTYDKQALSGDKEYAKRTDKNWQITIDNSKKVKWQVKAKADEMVGETSHAKYKDATVYVDDLGNESSLAAAVLIAQGDENKVDPIINWQEDKGILFSVDPTSMRAENYKGTINWTLEETP